MEIPEYQSKKAFLEHIVKAFFVPQYSVDKIREACAPFKPPLSAYLAAQFADIVKYPLIISVAYDIGKHLTNLLQ